MGLLDPGNLDVIGRDLSYMAGNTFLALMPLLFAVQLSERWRGQPVARMAGNVLVGFGTLVLVGRLAVKGSIADHPVRSLAMIAAVLAFAVLWTWRVRAGDRWARSLGWLGVVAFAPNAPYILTDLFHYMQDVRTVAGDWSSAAVLAVMYGAFLVVGAAAWVLLLDGGRRFIERHPRLHLRPRLTLAAVSLVMAIGVYMGRIERFHSWHPLGEPVRFLREVVDSATSPGPLAFVVVWWVAIATIGWLGIALLDRIRRLGASPIRIATSLAALVSAALLLGAPLVSDTYRGVGVVSVPAAAPLDMAMCAAVGLVMAALGGRWLVELLAPGVHGFERSLAPTLLAVALAVLLMFASGAQWYSQFRGLCEYGPTVRLHGESCPSTRASVRPLVLG